jgi:hypothetical protein
MRGFAKPNGASIVPPPVTRLDGMRGRLGYLAAAAIIALWAAPAMAHSLFHAGQTVVAVPGFSDAVCTSQADLERYESATNLCAAGHQDECRVVRELEARKVCGFHYGVYIVKSVDASTNWIQISPDFNLAASYWAAAHSFMPAE